MAGADLGRGTAMRRSAAADAADIQGLLRSGYGTLTDAAFLLLRITDPAAARAWLATAPVTTASDLGGPALVRTVVQVALTAEGLRALNLPEPVLAGFSAEFLSGMADDAPPDLPGPRSRRLGDLGPGAPMHWAWGGPAAVPHVLVMLYAEMGALPALRAVVETPDWARGFAVMETLSTLSEATRREPFGFTDGISQPTLDWSGKRQVGTQADLAYTNLIAAGEFLLGYPNEYGLYTERPLLDPAQDPAGRLPRAEDDPARCDLGRNGSYLVLRQLHQDVAGFWHCLAAQSPDPKEQVRLAEAMVGRTLDGAPLFGRVSPGAGVGIPGVGPDPEDVTQNDFTYDADADGARCPIGAHVRRANPRTGDMAGGRQGLVSQLLRTLGLAGSALRDDIVASARFHRILRRGRVYGAGTAAGDVASEGGLHFICLNANIARQFEFVQGAWLASAKFDGLGDEADPLLGNREPLRRGVPTDRFTLPAEPGTGVRPRLQGLPRFVTVRGGAYFFLPGVRALRYLAATGPD